ncbi:hypothetical protein QC764_602930 [Podospora pseudoanserina]|uniref:F-box domain-containing protein n=1 Tax=Podospora pseudoanserina TaxID=2609844 RepID=A0ABR0HSW5_9PEZI|nr:hypothetical protein QC764_602930 [Podospora pseudoanserina]
MNPHQEEPKPPEDNHQQPESIANSSENEAAVHDTRDPVMVARLHNREHSRLLKLPEELILKIVKRVNLDLAVDVAAVFSLGRVSQVLRRIIKHDLAGPLWPSLAILSSRYGFEPPSNYIRTRGAQDAIRYCLRKDLLCKTCLPRNDLRMTRNGRVVPRHPSGKRLWDRCKFESHHVKGIGPLYCSGCDTLHHHRMVSTAEREVKGNQRICIMRTGVVRICKHRVVSWADIETHEIDLLTKEPQMVGSWFEVDVFREAKAATVQLIACEDPEHERSLKFQLEFVSDKRITFLGAVIFSHNRRGITPGLWSDLRGLTDQTMQDQRGQSVRYGRDGEA